MHTKTLGEILKQHRETHGMSLESLSQITRIKIDFLRDLENNVFEALPAAVFVRGYIAAYARTFGFDHQPLWALLRRDFKESAKGTLVPRDFTRQVFRGRASRPFTLVVAVVAVIFLTLFGYVGVQWYQFSLPPSITLLEPNDQSRVAGELKVRGKTNPDAVVLVNDVPVSLQPDGSFETTVLFSSEGLGSVLVTATDRSGKTGMEQRTVFVSF